MRDKVLILNPGSTSTKIAVYCNDEIIHLESIQHSHEDLLPYAHVQDQKEYRLEKIQAVLDKAGIGLDELICISARGGLLHPIPGGTYEVNDQMVYEMMHPNKEHACNLGALIGKDLADRAGIKAYIVDPVVVDELWPWARMTGLKEVKRVCQFHVLNQKAIARKVARVMGKTYNDVNVIVCHIGGGITVGMHNHGKVVDVNNGLDGDGPMSPERSGGLPNADVLDLAFNHGLTYEEAYRTMVGKGGLVSHLGTNDARTVEAMIDNGDEYAKLVLETMAYQIAKEVGALATTVNGRVDAIALTGGIVYSKRVSDWITDRVSFIAPVYRYPGEGEIQALYEGAMRVVRGEEDVKIYE